MRNFTPMDATPDYSPTCGSSSAAISHGVSAAASALGGGAGSGGGGTGTGVGAGSSGGGGSTGAGGSAGSQVSSASTTGSDDRFLGGRLLFRIGCGLDGFIVVFWVVIQCVVNVVDVPRLIDVGWIRQRLVGRSQQAAERIGELLSESGQAAADVRQSAE